jgi:hypothetical protein
VSSAAYTSKVKAEAKYSGIGMVLIKGNKRAFGRPFDKVINLLHVKQQWGERDTEQNPEYNTNK